MPQNLQSEQRILRGLVLNAVREGLSHLSTALREKPSALTGQYRDWHELSHYTSGLPSFNKLPWAGPPDYSGAFHGNPPLIRADDLQSFQGLLEFVKSHEFLKDWFIPPLSPAVEKDGKADEFSADLLEFMVYRIPAKLIDRHIHLNEGFEFSQKTFDNCYEELTTPIFHDRLRADICVPVLFLKFESEEMTLTSNAQIKLMPDNFHLARASVHGYGSGVHKAVFSAATHILVLKGWYAESQYVRPLSRVLSDATSFPLNTIDLFFAALLIITGFSTGYAQLLVRPHGWALHYRANLPPLEGASIKAYPNRFDNFYWQLDDIPVISNDSARDIGILFKRLMDIKENSILIALRRLNLCFLRDSDEDSILDATIGLEALLSDDDRQEMTHKLAMRAAGLAKVVNDSSKLPFEVFSDLKKIYKHRSAVVHGSTKTDRTRVITSKENRPVEVSSLATEYLRFVLRILIEHPEYRTPAKIDEFLLRDEDPT